MSFPSGEFAASPESALTPELESFDHGDALRKQFALDDNFITEQQPKLWATAERVASTVINPDQQNAIAVYAGVTNWSLFGKPGDPLPAGMILGGTRGDTLFLNNTIPYFHGGLNGLVNVDEPFRRSGLREVADTVNQALAERSSSIETVVSDFIVNSAEYRLLSSFDIPQRKPDEVPLNSYWRQVRERQIEQTVRTKYGHTQEEPLLINGPADRELRRRFHVLDDEVMTLPSEPKSHNDAVLKARAYLTPYVAQAFEADVYGREGQTFGDVYYEESNGLHIRAQDEEEGVEFYDLADDAGWKLSDNLYVGPRDMQFIAAQFLSETIQRIMDPRTAIPMKIIINESLQSTSRYIRERLIEAAVAVDLGNQYSYEPRSSNAMIFLRQPSTVSDQKAKPEVKAGEMDHTYSWDGVFRGKSDLSTAGELMRDAMVHIGKVQRYEPLNFRADARILQQQARHLALPANAAEENLVITLYSPHNTSTVPFVPGYVLVSESSLRNRYGFTVDPNGDPYFSCEIAIENSRQAALAEIYQSMGLGLLADKLRDSPNLTVDQLVEMIREEAVYYTPRQLEWHSMENDVLAQRQTYINNLENFAMSVRKGRLYVQCTGASHFLKYSLEKLFGTGCAGVVNGNTISGHTPTITAARHAQAIFAHEGRQYILDAQPEQHGLADADAFKTSGDYVRDHKAAQAPRFDLAGQLPHESKLSVNVEKDTATLVSELLTSFTERLRVAFDQPDNESLYSYVVNLPLHDPARRTLELIFRLNKGLISKEEVASVITFIDSFAAADPELRGSLGFGHYSVDFLDQLQSTVWYVKYILRKDERQANPSIP